MSYQTYVGRTARHLGVVDRDARAETAPPCRGSWAAWKKAEEAAQERAKKFNTTGERRG